MKRITLTPPVSAHDHTQGYDQAPVTLVEYADYQCPYCGAAHPVIQRLRKSLGKQLRFVFRNFPLSMHPYAFPAAQAAEAAGSLGKFWEMHDAIFENQAELHPDLLPILVKEIGLDANQFTTAMRASLVTTRIQNDYESGVQSGVNGTPSFFINGQRYDGEADYEALRAALFEANAELVRRSR